MIWGLFSPKKAEKPIDSRLRAALAGGRQVTGRFDLAKEVWPGGWTLDDIKQLNSTIARMMSSGELIEARREIPGSHEHPAAIEFVYSLAPARPGSTGTVRKLAPDGMTWLVYKNGRLVDEVPV
jgi:hypothetical protein